VNLLRAWRFRVRIPREARDFPFSETSTVYVGPTQLATQSVPGALSPRISARGVRMTTHLYLVPRLIMNGRIPPLALYDVMSCAVTILPFKLFKHLPVEKSFLRRTAVNNFNDSYKVKIAIEYMSICVV